MLRGIARKIGIGKALLWMRKRWNTHKHQRWAMENDERLCALTHKHKGEDAVIIGMGPSLKVEDLEKFQKMASFACNKIFLAYSKTRWRPNYYSVIDILVAENNRDEILSADHRNSLPIHSKTTWNILKNQRNALCYKYEGSIANWNYDATAIMNGSLVGGILSQGCTVIIDQIQMAYAMGFKTVYLVGVDFSFSGGIKTSEKCRSGEVLISEGESNHFHKDYRKPGEKWTVPKLEKQRHAFAFCRAAFEREGRKLINASRKSELDVIQKVEFNKIF
jgi:hypothetical protein